MAKRFIRSDYIDEDNQSVKENTSKNKIFSPSINDVQLVIQNKSFNPVDYKSNTNKNKIFSPVGAVDNTAPLSIPSINNKTFYSNKGTPIVFGNNADDKASKAGSVATGLSNGLSLGIVPKLLDKLQPGMSQEAEDSNKIAYNVGNMAGYLAPGIGGTKLVKPLLKGITNPLLNRVAEGALVGSGMTGIEDLVKRKTGKETLTDMGVNAGIGAGLDLALHGAGKVIPKIFSKTPIKNEVDKVIPSAMPLVETPIANPSKKYSGKYTVKNTALEQAQRDYDNAIEAINNHFGTNKLTPEEIAQIKPTLGIDLEKLTNNLANTKTDVRAIGERQRLARISGVENTSFNPVKETSTEKIPFVSTYRQPKVKDQIPSVVTYREKTPIKTEIRTSEEIPLVSLKKEKIKGDINNLKHHEVLNTPKFKKYYDKEISNMLNYENLDKEASKKLKNKLENNTNIYERIANDYIENTNFTKTTEDFKGYIEKPIKKQNIIPNKTETTPIWSGYETKVIGKPLDNKVSGYKTVEHTKTYTEPVTTSYPQGKLLPKLKPLENINKPVINETGKINPALGATDRTKLSMDIVSSNENKVKPGIKEAFKNAYTRLVDINNPIKNISEDTYVKATNSKNVGGTVDHILTNGLVDREGNKIGESLKDIVKDIPKDEEADFMNYVLQKHNIDRAREGKAVDSSFTSEGSAKATKLIEQKHPLYAPLADRFTKFIRDFESEWGNKSGLISDELWQNLQKTYQNYVPTQREFSTLEEGFKKTNGKGFVNQGTPLSKATGSDRNIINPIENTMNLVNRTVRTAKYNEVGQSMLKELRSNPKLSKYAEIIPAEAVNSNAKNIVTVLENGEPVHIQVNDKILLESLQNINKNNIGTLETAAKKGTGVFKALITQYNPVFGIRNMLRDIPTAYINGSENNPIKFTRDLIKAGKELGTNGEIAQRYKAVGGGGANFFNASNTAKSAKELTKVSIPKKIIHGIEHINSIIESAPRLAEFNRILDETGDVQKALYAASDVTTNFSRGGDITKHLDSAVPYLNAGVQGLDKLARQFINKPIPTVAKGLVGITSLTMYLDHMNKDNPNYQKLDNRTKDNYFLIPHGETFIKIPKSRELGVLFGSLFERSLRASRGDSEAFKDYFRSGKGIDSFAKGTVGTNFSPANPLESNIFSPITNLRANKDFADREIVPRSMTEDNRSKYLQYDEKTSEITKKIAEVVHKTGVDLSPKQMDYLIKSYTGVIGQLGLPATTKSKGNTGSKILKPITSQFIADPVYNNQILSNFYDNYDTIKTKSADKNILEKIPSKVLTKEEKQKSIFTKASADISKLNKEIRTAEFNNDLDKVRSLRIKMLEAAYKANNQYKK